MPCSDLSVPVPEVGIHEMHAGLFQELSKYIAVFVSISLAEAAHEVPVVYCLSSDFCIEVPHDEHCFCFPFICNVCRLEFVEECLRRLWVVDCSHHCRAVYIHYY